MATYIFVHGSWHGGWCWYKMKKLHLKWGDIVFAPTLSGMKYNDKFENKKIGLNNHIQDIIELIRTENLSNIILVGHSYAGLVISGVASKIPKRINKLVYLDAFLPNHNESLFDMSFPKRVESIKSSLVNSDGKSKKEGIKEVWLVPPHDPEMFGVFGDEALWLKELLVFTPIQTFEQKVILNNPEFENILKFYIRCSECPIPTFDKFEKKANKKGWKTFKIKSGHDVMITKPTELFKVLKEIEKY